MSIGWRAAEIRCATRKATKTGWPDDDAVNETMKQAGDAEMVDKEKER
jgi:hypothetical protein